MWESTEMKSGISIGKGILWVLIWFGFMLFYTALDVVVWRKTAPLYEQYLNFFSIILCMLVFLILLIRRNHFRINLFGEISFQGILLAAGCAVLLYFILDRGLDPVFEQIFPASEETYQQMLQTLSSTPVISVC